MNEWTIIIWKVQWISSKKIFGKVGYLHMWVHKMEETISLPWIWLTASVNLQLMKTLEMVSLLERLNEIMLCEKVSRG
jgi:hypothetical protein